MASGVGSIGGIGGGATARLAHVAGLIAPLALVACTTAAPMPDGGARAPRVAEVAGYSGAFLPSGELRVTRTGSAFGHDEGAEAKRAANALCGGRVASGDRDNFREGAWLFPGGCA